MRKAKTWGEVVDQLKFKKGYNSYFQQKYRWTADKPIWYVNIKKSPVSPRGAARGEYTTVEITKNKNEWIFKLAESLHDKTHWIFMLNSRIQFDWKFRSGAVLNPCQTLAM